MAAGQHKLSRRALLGAALSSPLILSGAEPGRSPVSKDAPLVRHPGLDPGSMNTALVQPDTAVFMGSGFRRNDDTVTVRDRALIRFQKAQAALDAAAGIPDEDLYDRLGARHDRALGYEGATASLKRNPARQRRPESCSGGFGPWVLG
jgi:hypothetical protein